MYSISDYGAMMTDKVRMDAYREALRRTVKPGHVVVDIGTGTGIFALLACQLGARRVYAIEPNDVIQVAREIATDNGYADRIVFIQKPSTEVSLPERADVIISDLRGMLPLFHTNLSAMADARERFLAPGGVMIPAADALQVAVVAAPKLYRQCEIPWKRNEFGLDMSAARSLVTNAWTNGRIGARQLLTEPQCWARLDYAMPPSRRIGGRLRWKIARKGTAHGICLWFDAVLAEGVGFTNGPGETELVYGRGFLPWTKPVRLAPGDTVSVDLDASQVGSDYVWRWDSEITAGDGSGRVKARFEQSTFHGMPLSLQRLRTMAEERIPRLSQDGEIGLRVLQRMAEGTALGVIARDLAAEFPSRFSDWRDALGHIGEMSQEWTQ